MKLPRVIIDVSDSAGLVEAVRRLPFRGGLIRLRPGFYDLVDDLVIDKRSVTLRGLGDGDGRAVLRNGRSDGYQPLFRALGDLRIEDVEFVGLRIAI